MKPVKAINFEQDIFDRVVGQELFYDPKIVIKPAHLANGLFRAVCGRYTDSCPQHQVLYPKKYPDLPNAFSELKDEHLREMLHALLNADSRMFSNVRQSSYTGSHISHITSDNHDRKAGEWLAHILTQDSGRGPSPNTFQISKEVASVVCFRVDKTERDQGATSWGIDYANSTQKANSAKSCTWRRLAGPCQ